MWLRKFPPEHGLSCRSGLQLYLSDKEEGVRVRTDCRASAQQSGLTVEETPLLGKALQTLPLHLITVLRAQSQNQLSHTAVMPHGLQD